LKINKLRLILTEHCNKHCEYCDCRQPRPDFFDLVRFKTDISEIDKYVEYDTVTFSGGEPGLLSQYDMSELFHMFRDKKILLFTNGEMFKHDIPDNVKRIYIHGDIKAPDSLNDISHNLIIVNTEIIDIPDVPKVMLIPAIARNPAKRSRCIFTAIRYTLLMSAQQTHWTRVTVPFIDTIIQRPCMLGDEMIFNAPKRLIKECHGKAGKRKGFPISGLRNRNLNIPVNDPLFCSTCWYPFEITKDRFKIDADAYFIGYLRTLSYRDAVNVMKGLL